MGAAIDPTANYRAERGPVSGQSRPAGGRRTIATADSLYPPERIGGVRWVVHRDAAVTRGARRPDRLIVRILLMDKIIQ